MIAVSLQDGKTLNVKFRSLNTRVDIFHPKKLLAEKFKPYETPKPTSIRTSSQDQPDLISSQHHQALVQVVRLGVIRSKT